VDRTTVRYAKMAELTIPKMEKTIMKEVGVAKRCRHCGRQENRPHVIV
jgi:hypothetical protein